MQIQFHQLLYLPNLDDKILKLISYCQTMLTKAINTQQIRIDIKIIISPHGVQIIIELMIHNKTEKGAKFS